MRTITDINKILENCTYEEFMEFKKELESDDRKGVKNLISRYIKKFENLEKVLQEYNNRRKYELQLIHSGFKFIAGVDEVGRGPLAGPVCAAAVILNPDIDIVGIKDSKKLSESQRQRLSDEIKSKCLAYSIEYASVEEIDEYNILNATKLAMKRAIDNLKLSPDYVLIDALTLETIDIPQFPIIKGDDLSVSIGAASIIAKVERDRYMDDMSNKYPEYFFKSNKGYGTKEHIDAIKKYGICEIHRKSFLKNII
jgi:ribonuclease HII